MPKKSKTTLILRLSVKSQKQMKEQSADNRWFENRVEGAGLGAWDGVIVYNWCESQIHASGRNNWFVYRAGQVQRFPVKRCLRHKPLIERMRFSPQKGMPAEETAPPEVILY
jgi:hypothetical protein